VLAIAGLIKLIEKIMSKSDKKIEKKTKVRGVN